MSNIQLVCALSGMSVHIVCHVNKYEAVQAHNHDNISMQQ